MRDANKGHFTVKLLHYSQLPNILLLGEVNFNQVPQQRPLCGRAIILYSGAKHPNMRGSELERGSPTKATMRSNYSIIFSSEMSSCLERWTGMRVACKGCFSPKIFYYFQIWNIRMLGEVNCHEGQQKSPFLSKLFCYFQLPNVLILGEVKWNEGRQQRPVHRQAFLLFSAPKHPNARRGELEWG